MKERFQKSSMILTLCIGIFIGATMVGGAAAAGVVAQPTWQPTYVDGRQVQMDAYNIGGYNYVKLRDIGKEVGFNVFWDNGVQVDTTAEYTGVKPADSSAAADTGNASAENEDMSRLGRNYLQVGMYTEMPQQKTMRSVPKGQTTPPGIWKSDLKSCS